MGPRDVIGGSAVGVLNEDLRVACLGALTLSREECRKFALTRSWATSARQFIAHVSRVAPPAAGDSRANADARDNRIQFCSQGDLTWR
jgi:hypothetical protein